MKKPKQIIARAVILLCLSDRCACEKSIINGKSYSLKEREGQRKSILNWLKKKRYLQYTTSSELDVFSQEVRQSPDKNILLMQVQYEAIEPLLWSIGLIKKLSVYDNFVLTDFHPTLQISGDHLLENVLDKCLSKTEEEVVLQNEIAMLWNWRAREYGKSKIVKNSISDFIKNTFGKDTVKVLKKISSFDGVKDDFLLNGVKVNDLSKVEYNKFSAIALWRHQAFEWVLNDVNWDEVELNT